MKKLMLVLFAVLLPQLGFAADTKEEIKQKLLQEFPNLPIEEIRKSTVNSLYEVYAGPIVIYTTADGRYLFHGDVIDLEKQKHNVTETTRKQLRIKSLNRLGENNMIVFASDKPETTITIFTDIDCGYCRKLHQEVSELNKAGVNVRYVAFPRTGVDSPSYEKAVNVWCADDKKQALTTAKHGKPVETVNCDNPVQQEFELGVQFGVAGTPTIVFADGSIIPGYMPPEILIAEAKRRNN